MKILWILPLATIGLIGWQLARPTEGPRKMAGQGAHFVANAGMTHRESPLAEIWGSTKELAMNFATGQSPSDLGALRGRQTRAMEGPTVSIPSADTYRAYSRTRARSTGCRP